MHLFYSLNEKMSKLQCKTFTDPVTGTLCEGDRQSGRDPVEVQRRPGRYPETDPNLENTGKDCIKGRRGDNGGGRGKNKRKWEREELLLVWERHVRSELMGGREDGKYISNVMDIWNGKDVSVRNQASILSQIRNISAGNRLSEFDKREIESKIN